MPSSRQDSWTPDEDILLAEIVLRHIREGSTQLKAFEEVGIKLTRTAAACGFRWNSYVRKLYEQGIELAKKQRKQRKKQVSPVNELHVEQTETYTTNNKADDHLNEEEDFKEVIAYLKKLFESSLSTYPSKMKDEHMTKIAGLEKIVQQLEIENARLTKEYGALDAAHESLAQLMERAREVVADRGDGR